MTKNGWNKNKPTESKGGDTQPHQGTSGSWTFCKTVKIGALHIL